MKKLFTFVIFLLTCLNLVASVHPRDTTKSSASAPDNSKSIVNHSDSLNSLTPIVHRDNFATYGFRHAPDSISMPITMTHADSLQISEATHLLDSLTLATTIKYKDSLKLSAQLMHLDSLRLPEYVHLMDSLKQKLKFMSLDSLKQQVKLNKYELLSGPIYTQIALRYLDYDTISNKRLRLNYQTEALSYTMKALHRYSAYNDTAGLRLSFDDLTKVYFAQKKYPQAKWFILQSNTISRLKKDTPNIIASLITLSAIKSDLKDYTLAMRDLNEALQLSVSNHYQKTELDVLKNYAMLYSRMKNYPKEALILKKRDSLEEGMRKTEEAKLLAKVNEQHAQQVKKLDSLQSKKKVYTYNIKKPYKGSSNKKTVLL
jgi:tetratricopeptide (TPR) repeat protein